MNRPIALLLFALAFAAIACGPAPAATTAPEATKAPAATAAPAATTGAVVPAPTAAKPAVLRGGTFTDSSFADAATMSPLLSQDTASSAYVSLVYASLTRLDPKSLEVIGNLYDGKPAISADGATLTWKLRQGLKWSDGSPITAKDVEFTWKQMVDEKGKFPYRQLYADSFKSVVAKDDYTVEYTMKTPGFCPAVINSGLVSPVPAAVFSKVDNIWQNDLNNKPTVYDGMFALKEWQKDNFASFNPANTGFVRGQPNLDSYIYRIVKDNTVNTQLFKTQEVDVATPDPQDWDEVSKLPHAQPYRYYPASSASWTYIGFNLRNPILSDKRVRQAISYAVNKQEFIDKIRLGFAKPQYSIYHATSWAYTDDVKKFDFSPQKAKDLLKEAGWTPGSDGILVKDGKPLKLRIHYNAGNKQREQISVITQQYLKDIGISAEVIAEEWTAYLDRVNKTHDMEMYVLGWSTGIEPNGMGNIWKSDGGQNATGYNNPEIDKLFNDAANVPGCSQADRKKVYDKIQQILAEDAPYVYLYTNEQLVVYNKRIQVNPLSPLGLNYQIEQWAVNKAAPHAAEGTFMTRYLVRRILQTIPILLVISILQFTLINAAPGGPIRAMINDPNMTQADIQRLEESLGLNEPLPVRYLKWMGSFLTGNLGYSYFTHRPVTEMLAERLPATIELGLAASLISYLVGIPLGVYAGLHRGGRIDHVIRAFTSVLNAVPHWWLGLLCIIGIANFKLSSGVLILPTGGIQTIGQDFNLLDNLWHLFLPALMLGTAGWVGFARFLRSETLEVLGNDYVRTAHAKGLSPQTVTYRHVLRNALIPVITISAGLLVSLVSGAVLYENIFSWPGIGRLLYETTLKKDYPVSLGVGFILTVLAVAGRLVADVAYAWVDPRIRYD